MATELPPFRKGFDDIEMLDIETSDESISTSIPSSIETLPEPIDLKEWLVSSQPLEFQLNVKQYKDSVEQDDYDVIYTRFSNAMYKLLEELGDVDLRFEDDENIGLISNNKSMQDIKYEKAAKINKSFSKLIEIFENFLNDLKNGGYNDISEKYESIINILDCLHATNFITDVNLKPIYLNKWINRFDPQPETELVESIMISPKPYLHPLFWNKFISTLITRGLMDQAVNAIKNSGYEELKDNNNSEIYEIIEDFENLLISYNTMSIKGQFPHWKLSCCEFRDLFPKFKKSINDSTNLTIIDQIHDLLFILTGLPKTISNYCTSWYEIISSLSLYQIRDDVNMYNEYFEISINERPPLLLDNLTDEFKILEKVFIDVWEKNYLHVLTKIDEIDSCTSSIVSRLLELKGDLIFYYTSIDINSNNVIKNINNNINSHKTISEYLLTKYSFQCLHNHSLVPIGIGILVNKFIVSDLKNSEKIISSFLPNYCCKTNDDLEWCLTICAKLGLIKTASELYKIHGKKSLKDGYIFEALNMLVNCYNEDGMNDNDNLPKHDKDDGMKEVHHIVWDIIFQDSLIHNRPIKDELINNVIEHNVKFEINPIIRQCLSPYGVLFEFFKSLNNLKLDKNTLVKDKISRLIHLLEFVHLPKKFYPLLLSQLIPFFLNNEFIFQIPDLIVIIELIDNFENSVNEDDFKNCQDLYKYSIENIENPEHYDWRKIMTDNNVEIPKNIQELIRYLREEISIKISKVYVGGF